MGRRKDRDLIIVTAPILTHTHVNPDGSTIEIRRLGVASGIVVRGRRAMTVDFWLKITNR